MKHRGIETPACMAGRPVDHRGFPVPWFVTEKDENGNWDFVHVRAERWEEAVRTGRCWVSGEKLGRYKAFVIGPMCVINRISADPPVRYDVALWSVRICPFLSRPGARRAADVREATNADGVMDGQRGIALARNPGVSAVYVTETYAPVRQAPGVLQFDEPTGISFWREGREATPAEIWASIDSGLPALQDTAEKEGHEAVVELGRYLARAMKYLPPRTEAVSRAMA